MFDLLPPAIGAALLREAFPDPGAYLAAIEALKGAGWVFDAGEPGGPAGAWRRWIGENPPDTTPLLPPSPAQVSADIVAGDDARSSRAKPAASTDAGDDPAGRDRSG